MNLHDFHFLRPVWFLAIVPLAALLLLLWRRHLSSRSWQTVVDPQLLPHLLIGSTQQHRPWGIVALALGGLLAITALAGPVWNKQQQPVFRHNSALVVLLDLSQSMNATDVTPSRLQMAKFKLQDLLARRKEGETALVVYAAAPFTVTPLTNDTDNIRRQLSSLTPELMPAQGSRADLAITQAQALLQQAGATHGNVLLITDGINNTPSATLEQAVKKLTDAGYQLSVLGVGSADGAPIPLQSGGFLQDNDGAIVVAKVDEQALTQLATQSHGIYRHLSANSDSDTDALTATFTPRLNGQQGKKVKDMKSDQWHEQGPWLLLPLLPLVALAFRRGYLLLLFFTLLIPVPRSAYALGWDDLWQRPDQRAAQALADNKPEQAAKQFKDPQWRAAAHYRAGDYQTTLKDLEGQKSAEADYNRGNALAHIGKFPEAVKAYDRALEKNPQLSDAKDNRELVQKWLQQQQSNQQQKNSNGKNGQQSNNTEKPSPDSNASQTGNSDKQKSDNNNSQQESASKPQQNQSAASGKKEQNPQQSSSDTADNHSQTQQAQPSSTEATESRQEKQKPQQATADNDNETIAKEAQSKADSNDQPSTKTATPQSVLSTQPDDNNKSKQVQATEQWLRRIPDDPGGLWRRKFLYQYKQGYQSQQGENKPW